MVLDDALPAGATLAEHVPIADDVLELEVTPNRPDVMGVYGVARDLHAVTAAPLAPDPTDADAEPAGADAAEDHASVEIDPEICLRFTARVFEDVKVGPSPLWLKQRLMAAGQRPISNVVDITNYVMLQTGQPLHAFDLDKVRGARIVRAARARGRDDGRPSTTPSARSTARRRWSATPRDRAASPGSWAAQISEVSDDHHARADGGGHLGRPEHHAHLEGAWAAQRGRRRASRSSCTPSRRSPPSGWRRG